MNFSDFVNHSNGGDGSFLKQGITAAKVAEYIQTGVEKYSNRMYGDSILDFTSAIELNGNNASLYNFRGTAYEDDGDNESAAEDFLMAYTIDRTSSLAAYRLGMVFSRENDFDKAIHWLRIAYQNALDITDMSHLGFGKNTIFFVGKQIIAGNLGNFLLQKKQFAESLIVLNHAIALDPEYAVPYFNKGVVLFQTNDKKEAKLFFEKAYAMGIKNAKEYIEYIEEEENDGSDWRDDFKKEMTGNVVSNLNALIKFKGNTPLSLHDIEQEVIYFSCSLVLQNEKRTGENVTDDAAAIIVNCIAEIMMSLFPGQYTNYHAESAIIGARLNLSHATNMADIIDDYYEKIYNAN